MSKVTKRFAIILALLWVIALFYQNTDFSKKIDTNNNFLSSISSEDIQTITISPDASNTIILEKSNEKFKIGGTKELYASDEAMQALLNGIDGASKAKAEIVSINAEKQPDLGIDDQSVKVTITQTNGDEISFIIGKTGSNLTDTYISRVNSNETVLIAENMERIFNRDEWADKTVFNDDTTIINELRLQYPDRQFKVAKFLNEEGEPVWKSISPNTTDLNESNIQKIVDIMANLSATSIPAQSFEGTDLEKHLIIIQATGDGVDNTLMVGGKYAQSEEGDTLYYAKNAASDNIYLITEEQRNTLNTTLEKLK